MTSKEPSMLRVRIVSGTLHRHDAEALLVHLCRANPGSYSDLNPAIRAAFLSAAQSLQGDKATRERIGLHLMWSLEFDKADRHYDQLIAANADGAVNLLARKAALFAPIDSGVAIAAYQRVVELCPDDDRALMSLATLLATSGQFGPAADAYRTIVTRSGELSIIQDATARLHTAVALLRLEPLGRWAHFNAVIILPKAQEHLPWLASEIDREGPLAWDFHATVALVHWVLNAIRTEGSAPPPGMTAAQFEGVARAIGCAPIDRSGGLPEGIPAERVQAFDARWSVAAEGALRDCAAFLGTGEDKDITGTGNWILGACGASDVEFDDLWLVGDAISMMAREFLAPAE